MYLCVFVSVYTRVCTGLCRLKGGLAVHPEKRGNWGVRGEKKGEGRGGGGGGGGGRGGCPPPGDEP